LALPKVEDSQPFHEGIVERVMGQSWRFWDSFLSVTAEGRAFFLA
jgi:hypothetical protein